MSGRVSIAGIRGNAEMLEQLDQTAEWLGLRRAGRINRSEAIRQAIAMMYALAEPETWRAFLAFMSATGELNQQAALKGIVHHGLSEAMRTKAMIERWCAEHPGKE